MINKHGNRVIDYKHYFEIPKNKNSSEYNIDIWLFIPSNLHPQSYSSKDFFNDLSFYTRYNAPNLTLNSLNDFYNEKNPLYRLGSVKHVKENYSRIEYELKTLLNTLKVTSRQTIETLKAMSKFSYYEAERNLTVQCNRLNTVLDKLYSYYKDAPNDLSQLYLLTIEGVSIRIEKTLYKFYDIFPKKSLEILAEITRQREFRNSMGFSTVFGKDKQSNSNAIYKEHLIKKWSESIMYINNESSKTQKGLKHIFLGSAAAVAMLVAGIITIIATKWLGEETIYWFVTALIAYSLKDRIKDILKAIFLRRASTILSDRILNIVSPGSKKRCGKSRESVDFPGFSSLPKNIKELRFKQREDLDIKQFQEEIIHYTRSVKLNTRKLYKGHSRLLGIKEIMRFDLRKWFYKMDKVKEKCYYPEEEKLVETQGEREYHFSAIVKTSNNNEIQIRRYRITANNKKIKKVIELD